MCGIAGTVFIDVDRTALAEAIAVLSNRGPDGHGTLVQGAAALAHARLAVIDVSDHASQPMMSACGRYSMVFNGEVYNYREMRARIGDKYHFHSESDSEVVLASYVLQGPRALNDFVGMFAFAIWDSQREELFVARDRLGVKPMYYARTAGGFAFASRPQALLALLPGFPRRIDKQSLRYFFESGYTPAPHTIYEGIAKLEPGSYLQFSRTGMSQTRYWSAASIAVDPSLETRDEASLLDELEQLVTESVRLRMVSDVRIGAFLSGGIDSSLVAALMQRHSSTPTETFTIGFEDAEFDESRFAGAVAQHIGAHHHLERLRVDDLLGLMPTFIENFDEPFYDYSAFPVMAVSRFARRSVTVSLSGDGGDEAFGGYHYYPIMQRLAQVHRMPIGLRHFAGKALALLPNQRARWIGEIVAAPRGEDAFAFMRGTIKDARNLMQEALRSRTRSLAELFRQRAESFAPGLSYPELGMRLDLAYTLPDDYLQKVDVGSMAFSLEGREPMLDHRIVEWAARLPLCWKLRAGTNKYLLRKLAYRFVPKALLDRPKMGFSLPMASWLRGGLREWASNLLEDKRAFDDLELDHAATLALWQAHQAGRVQAHSALWTVLVSLQFHRSHFSGA